MLATGMWRSSTEVTGHVERVMPQKASGKAGRGSVPSPEAIVLRAVGEEVPKELIFYPEDGEKGSTELKPEYIQNKVL